MPSSPKTTKKVIGEVRTAPVRYTMILDALSRYAEFKLPESVLADLARVAGLKVGELHKVLEMARKDWAYYQDIEKRYDEVEKVRAKAAEMYEDEGTLEIDPEAEVSEGEDGTYVQAWVFVRKEDYERR